MAKNNPMQLNEGNDICPKCGGVGKIRIRNRRCICPKCKGKGQLDWISNIMGAKKS